MTRGEDGGRKLAIILALLAASVLAFGGCGTTEEGASGDDGGGDEQSGDTGGGGEESGDSESKFPVVKGTWDGTCNQYSAGDEDACKQLDASKVTCQWIDGKVHMTITFKNNLGAHVTVHLEPRYKLKNAGKHGEGITNVEDVGIDAGATRKWETDLDPAGVEGQPKITACNPALDVLQGVELG